MVDTLVLGTSSATSEGSSPFSRTIKDKNEVNVTSSKGLESKLSVTITKKKFKSK